MMEINIPRQRNRNAPRISVNKLGEYLTEPSASRRRRILLDQKRPKDFIPPYYDPAREAIIQFVAGGSQHENVILEEIARLQSVTPTTLWEQRQCKSCAQALMRFLESFNGIPGQDKLNIMPGLKTDPSHLLVGSVKVTVRPDLLLFGEDSRGGKIVGAVKLHFPKSFALGKQAGQYVTTLLLRYVSEQLAGDEYRASGNHCIVWDIFSGKPYRAPQASTRRWQDIQAACAEIETVWPRL